MPGWPNGRNPPEKPLRSCRQSGGTHLVDEFLRAARVQSPSFLGQDRLDNAGGARLGADLEPAHEMLADLQRRVQLDGRSMAASSVSTPSGTIPSSSLQARPLSTQSMVVALLVAQAAELKHRRAAAALLHLSQRLTQKEFSVSHIKGKTNYR